MANITDSAPYAAFGADFSVSSPTPVFKLGARTDGCYGQIIPSSYSRASLSGGMEYIYLCGTWDTIGHSDILITEGMYGYISYIIGGGVIAAFTYGSTGLGSNNLMAINNVKDEEYSWFLVLNGDPINPLNPLVA
ncbi:hypothetical protein FACS189496_3030 [Bacilli bacterium]|nr:hypothetical protein FACS189496_3030 [Bacilli bacterium]